MELLEREPFLDALGDYATEAGSGHGRLVVVTGEAGIGKTTLIDAFRAEHREIRLLSTRSRRSATHPRTASRCRGLGPRAVDHSADRSRAC